jgi:replicative DNA helicase
MSDERLQPHDIDAERAVLGSCLIDQDAIYELPFLQPHDFYSVQNRQTFAAIRGLNQKGIAIDMLTVSAALRDKVDEEAVFSLVNVVPTSSNVRSYGKIVQSHAQRRALIAAAGKIASAGWDTASGIDDTMSAATAALLEATEGVGDGNMQSARDGLSELFDVVLRTKDSGKPPGLMTGLNDLDKLIKGLKPGNSYVIAGRPGMGKSALEGTIAHNIAVQGKVVVRFSLEMPAIQQWQRMVCINAGLNYGRLEEGKFTPDEWQRYSDSTGRMSEYKVFIDDTAAISASAIMAKCRRIQAQHGLDLVTVDYMQLMRSERYGDNRVQEVGDISRTLKQMAQALGVPVIALAQVSRGCEQRVDKRPLLSDLRDSGEIEQDAYVVMFVYRDDYYRPETSEVPGQVEVNVAKNRNGATGTAHLYFKADNMAIKNLARETVQL